MWGRIREGDSLEEKMIRSDIRMWGRHQRLESLEENTISTASLCVGIFWSDFKASVRTQLADRSTFLKGHPLPLPNSTRECDKRKKRGDHWKKFAVNPQRGFAKTSEMELTSRLEQVWIECDKRVKRGAGYTKKTGFYTSLLNFSHTLKHAPVTGRTSTSKTVKAQASWAYNSFLQCFRPLAWLSHSDI